MASIAPNETNYANETDARIPQKCSAYCLIQAVGNFIVMVGDKAIDLSLRDDMLDFRQS